MSPMPRAARAPHSSKVPTECPHCGSHVLTRRGTRKKKLEIVQLWRCASCKRTFTPGPQAIRNKTYPLRTVIEALSTYSLGYSLGPVASGQLQKIGGFTPAFLMGTGCYFAGAVLLYLFFGQAWRGGGAVQVGR